MNQAMLILPINRPAPVRPLRALLLATIALGLLLSGCGIVANRKPIPSGVPTATVHFGPMQIGFRSQSVHVNDGEFCRPAEFSRFHTIGAYLGSDIDVEVPADRTVFVSLTDSETRACIGAPCITSCASGVSFSPKPGASYAARLTYPEKGCIVEVKLIRNGVQESVETRPEPQRCLY